MSGRAIVITMQLFLGLVILVAAAITVLAAFFVVHFVLFLVLVAIDTAAILVILGLWLALEYSE